MNPFSFFRQITKLEKRINEMKKAEPLDLAQERAWSLAVERSYKVVQHMDLGAYNFRCMQQLADDGNLIAQGVMLEFTKARLAG